MAHFWTFCSFFQGSNNKCLLVICWIIFMYPHWLWWSFLSITLPKRCVMFMNVPFMPIRWYCIVLNFCYQLCPTNWKDTLFISTYLILSFNAIELLNYACVCWSLFVFIIYTTCVCNSVIHPNLRIFLWKS